MSQSLGYIEILRYDAPSTQIFSNAEKELIALPVILRVSSCMFNDGTKEIKNVINVLL